MYFLLTLLLLLRSAVAQSLAQTTRAIPPALAVGCRRLVLPPKLCSTCPLKRFNRNGNFAQRLDAFVLSTPACQRVLRRYVALNPCDTVRARQVANQANGANVRGLEIFMYSICETCCDCIPIGARVGEYNRRKAANTLLAPLRGNCVMHYFFDACKIMPDVTDVASPKKRFLGVKKPVCEVLNEWRKSGFGRDWQLDPKVEKLPRQAKKYLSRMTRFMGCKKRSIWESCVPMEIARGRI